MPLMATRKYEQRLRAESADDTRRRILDAVLRAAARRPRAAGERRPGRAQAGVARSTVYLVFGSRAGLFDALGRDLHGAVGLRRRSSRRSATPTRASTMRGGDRGGRRGCSPPSATSSAALYSMAQLDPEAVGGAIAADRERAADGHARASRGASTSRACCAPTSPSTTREHPLGDHELRRLRPALHRPRAVARRGDAAARRGRRAGAPALVEADRDLLALVASRGLRGEAQRAPVGSPRSPASARGHRRRCSTTFTSPAAAAAGPAAGTTRAAR